MLVHPPRATALSKRLSPASSVFAFSRVDQVDETDSATSTGTGHPALTVLAAVVNTTLVAGENLTVGSTVWLPAESVAPGR